MPRQSEQPRPDPERAHARAVKIAQQAEQAVLAHGSGFRYEVKRPGAVEVVMYSVSDGSVLRRIPVSRRASEVPPVADLDLRA
ncbi:MAG: hypothetical protein FJX76_06300 [Armatimonadetes bacterium]|nr:hypothetical protein [Armatimonadota bacterium]